METIIAGDTIRIKDGSKCVTGFDINKSQRSTVPNSFVVLVESTFNYGIPTTKNPTGKWVRFYHGGVKTWTPLYNVEKLNAD